MTSEILFSVIIPSFNRLEELKRCLISVENQIYKKFEVIVIDDNSNINLIESINIEDYAFNLTIIRNNRNLGGAESRNIGIDQAEYQWIAFLDDDDQWISSKLQDISEVIKSNPDRDFIYHNAEIVMVNEETKYITTQNIPDNYYESMLVKNIIGGTPMVVVKKSLLQLRGKFDKSLRSLQDYELWLRISKYFKPLYLNKTLSICYYTTQLSSVSKSIKNNLESVKYIRNKYKDDLNKLSKNQLNEKSEWEFSMLAHKSLLNYNRVPAAKYYLKTFLVRFKVKFFIASVISLVYPKLLFKLR